MPRHPSPSDFGNMAKLIMRNQTLSGNGWLWLRPNMNIKLFGIRHFCTKKHSNNNKKALEEVERGGMTREEAYQQVHNLDFMTATKILLTAPPKRKKFGLDFHLVQLFFVCLPSLAVYLVAQYARTDMKKMDADLQLRMKKAKAKEEEKLKDVENTSSTALLQMKARLDALEEVVKGIEVEANKVSHSKVATKDGEGVKKEQQTTIADGDAKQSLKTN